MFLLKKLRDICSVIFLYKDQSPISAYAPFGIVRKPLRSYAYIDAINYDFSRLLK